MDFSNYKVYDFDYNSAIHLSTGHSGRNYQNHWHSYGEIIMMGYKTPNVVSVGGNTYDLDPEDFVLAWPLEMHGIIDADRENILIIQFSNAFINSLYDLRRIMRLYRNLRVIRKSEYPELHSKLKSTVLKMKEIFFAEEFDREIRCCMLLMEFMLILCDYRKELLPALKEMDKCTVTTDVMKRMKQVTDYIKNNLTAPDLSQSAMAEMAGISRDYFSRIFKKVTGMNYSKWLNAVRLEKASELLAERGRSLTEVALLSGFQSIPSFNRVFREEKGMTPREYRALFSDVSFENQ